MLAVVVLWMDSQGRPVATDDFCSTSIHFALLPGSGCECLGFNANGALRALLERWLVCSLQPCLQDGRPLLQTAA
jgi:hypothetical protein